MSVSEFLFDPVDLPPAVKYEKLFENLPKLEQHTPKTGRRPTSRNSLLKALIYKSLRRFPFLSDLTFELNNNPSVSQALGFNPLAPAPSVERFSSFLHDTKNHELKALHQKLVQALIEAGVISGKSIAIDSCPIVVPLKENNLKTSMADRFDKTRRPAGDPDARLGVMIHYPTPFKKEVRYFWGYRNHVINDTATELPIWETTKKANVSEIRIAKALIRETKNFFDLNIEVVTGDTNYDAEDLLKFIIKELNALAIIPHNPRNEQPKGYQIKGDKVICEAGLAMYRKGKMRPKNTGILYCQYTCPIYYDKQIDISILCVPCFTKNFLTEKDVTHLFDLSQASEQKLTMTLKNSKNFIINEPQWNEFSHACCPLPCKTQLCEVIMPIATMQLLHISLYY